MYLPRPDQRCHRKRACEGRSRCRLDPSPSVELRPSAKRGQPEIAVKGVISLLIGAPAGTGPDRP